MACLPTPPAPRIVTLIGRARGRKQRRPAALEGVKRSREPVAGNVAQVLDKAPAVVGGDHVERDGLDAQAAQHLDALRPGGEVEHREQDRAGSEQLVASFGRAQHDDDVLAIRRGFVDDADPRRGGQVGVIGVAHAGPALSLDVHVDAHVREQSDERGQEGPPLAGLVVHAREADRELALAGHALPLSSFVGTGVAAPSIVQVTARAR